jgi:hypothetical protein
MRKQSAKFGVLLALALLATLLIAIHTTAFQQWLLHGLEKFADRAGVTVSASHLTLNLWTLQASLRDFIYDDRKGMRISAHNLSIEFPWNVFRSKVLLVNSFQADGFNIEIHPAEPAPARKPLELPRIRVDRMAIHDGRFSYSTPAGLPATSILQMEG